MANINSTQLSYELANILRGSTYSAAFATLYLYYSEKINKDAKYANEAKDITEYAYNQNTKEKLYKLLDSMNLDAEEFIKVVDSLIKLSDTVSYRENLTATDSVMELVYKLLNIKNGEVVVDAGSGYGSAIDSFNNYSKEDNINPKFLGFEISREAVIISKMLIEMKNIPGEIIQEDLIRDVTGYEFDKGYVFPPLGMIYSSNEDNYLAANYKGLFNSRSNSEWMFVFGMLDNLEDNGKMVALLPAGALFRTTSTNIRKYLVENNLIEGLISLPTKSINGLNVATTLLVMKKNSKEIKVVDATDMVLDSDSKFTTNLDVDTIWNEYQNNAVIADMDKIIQYDYNLNPSIYITEVQTSNMPYPEKISNISEILRGSQYTISKFKDVISDEPTEYQILTSSDIQNNIVDFDSLVYIEPDKKYDKFVLQEDDLVVTSKSTVVKSFVARNIGKRKIVVTGGMFIVRPNQDKMKSTFLKMFLDSSTGKQLMATVTQGAVIKTISLQDFTNLTVSCPPLEEQKKYSDRYNDLLMVQEGLKKQLDQIQEQLNDFYESNVEEEE